MQIIFHHLDSGTYQAVCDCAWQSRTSSVKEVVLVWAEGHRDRTGHQLSATDVEIDDL